MSYCHSSGFNYQPCSQSQKMSIGIVVDSVAKPRYGSKKEGDVSAGIGEKEGKHNVQRGGKGSSGGIMHKNDGQEGSVRADLLMKDSDNQASRPAISALHGKNLESAAVKNSEPDGGSQKERKRASVEEKSEKPVKNVEQEQPNETEIRSKEVLRMKLRQVLGSGLSGNTVLGGSTTCEVNADENPREQTLKGNTHFKPRQNSDNNAFDNSILGDSRTCKVNGNEIPREPKLKVDFQFKPRQNSDTIETDSENVEMKTKRPVTRSLARGRAPARVQPRKVKPKSVSRDIEQDQGTDIFSFVEKSAPSHPGAFTRGFSLAEENDRTKRGCGIKTRDTLSPTTGLKSIQPEKSGLSGCKKTPPAEESPFGGWETFSRRGCLDENLAPEAAMENTNFNQSPVAREKSLLPDAESPATEEKSQSTEPVGGQSPVPYVDDLRWPRYKSKKAVLNSPKGASPLTFDKKQNVHGSAQPEAGIHLEAISPFKRNASSEKDILESSDDAAEFKGARSSTPESSTEENDAGNGLFTPVRGELDSTEEVSSAKKVYLEEDDVDDAHTSSENGIRLVRKPALCQRKRRRSHDVDFSNFSPTLDTPKVVLTASGSAGDVLMECLNESPEDGLARVVSLLGLALEKVKTKMMSVTNKKCSEILLSAAEDIHSQLRDVESQIQTDLGKLTNLKTSKRKHMETRLQEQQEHLSAMHEKFKEDICQLLQGCKGAMEGLETHHIELRGAIEKQKASHRKLLSHTEAAVETHLVDAQRQMMSVRKLGKQKMQQLKVAIAECLKDGLSR